MPPPFTFSHEEGLVRYYRSIAEATDLGVLIYTRGDRVPDRVIREVATLDNVVGVKYATNDIDSFANLVSDVDAPLTWLNGLAERFAPAFFLHGAAGYTTGIGNFAPETTLALFTALEAGGEARSLALRDAMRPFESLRDESGRENIIPSANNVPAVKYGQTFAGLVGGPCRPPLVDLAPLDQARAETCLALIFEAVDRDAPPR